MEDYKAAYEKEHIKTADLAERVAVRSIFS